MRPPSIRPRTIRVLLRAAALAAILAGPGALAAVPQLGRDYFGSYAYDGTAGSSTFNMEIEKQKGKSLGHVAIFAMNLSQLEGKGTLRQKGTSLRVSTKASGKHAPKMSLVCTVGAGGDTLDGTFQLKRYKLETRTGTFSVAR